MKCNFAGPSIVKNEIRATIRKLKSSKATDTDSISVELLEALGDYGFDKIATLLNKILGLVRFDQISSSLYLQHCQRNQGQQSVICIERLVF